MAAGFTQDTVFHFLQSCGGSVKNADLLAHFRSFIRENPEREKNRELFKRFVNSLATVQQVDGVSYVVLRKKFRGNVPGGGEQGSRVVPGKKREVPPGNGAQNPPGSAAKPRQTPQLPGGTPGKQVLPAAGFILSDVGTNSNLSHQPVTSRFEGSIRPAAAQLVNLTPGQCQVSPQAPPKAPPQAHLPNVARHIRGAGHPLETTPAKIAADNHVQVPVTFRGQPQGRQALSQAGVSPPPETSGRQALFQAGVSPPPQASGRQTILQAGLNTPPETPGRQALLQSGLRPPPETAGRQALLQAGLNPPSETPGRQALLQAGLNPPSETPGRQALLQAGFNPPSETPGRQALLQAGLNPPSETPGRQALLQAGLNPASETPGRQALLQTGLNPPSETPGRQALLQAGLNPPPQTTSRHRHRQSYKSAVSHDDDDNDQDDTPVGPNSARRHAPHGSLGKALFAPSPSNIDSPAPSSSSSSSSERKLPQIYIQNAKGEMLSNTGLSWRSESDRQTEELIVPGLEYGSVPRQLTRRSLPEEVRRYNPDPGNEVPTTMGQTLVQPAGGCLEPRLHHSQLSGLSSSHSSIFTPSPGVGISRGLHCNSSLEELHSRPGKTGGDLGLQETLQLTKRNKLGVTHHSSDHLHVDQEPLSRNHSRGHLHTDQGESESSDGSTSSPHLRKQPACGRRVSSHLRSRMCLSLGADLDQLLQEDSKGGGGGGSEAARLNRLNLISSSLSLHRCLSSSSLSSCSTPPRCQSLGDLVEVRGRRSNPPAVCTRVHDEDQSKQSSVPLEAREHMWLVKGAAGAWPDIYSLFREDSSLLNRRDFISGFTVLHWIAKHGDHRVLNTLWYGVEKAGVNFDINARSTSGHTPLHIATIHGHKNIIRLLVNKFGADVRLRDTAGKKAWQYLDSAMPLDVFQLLGAPPQAALKGAGEVGKIDVARQSSRRRRRHRFSSASPVHKQLATSKVKRSSSLAAFLKHKSLNLYQAQQINVSV